MVAAFDVSDILLDDSDATPDEALDVAAPTRRGRGRPKGSTTRRARTGASGGVAGEAQTSRATGARELAALLRQAIGGLSIAASLFLSLDELAMSPEEANDIARPLARLLMRSGFASQVALVANKGGDWGKLIWASLMYAVRIYPLLVQRQQLIDLQRQQMMQAAQRMPPSMPPTSPMGVQNAGNVTSRPHASVQPFGQPQAASSASGNGADITSDAAVAAAAAAVGGAGLTDVDAFTARAFGDVAAVIRAAGG